MGKKISGTIGGSITANPSAPKGAAQRPKEVHHLTGKNQTAVLTSLLGTQLLLSASPPDYPLVKTGGAVPEELS